MKARRRELYGGIGLLIGFVGVLTLIFSPIFEGRNALQYLDALYNSISKDSAYYIPVIKEESTAFNGKTLTSTLSMADEDQARGTAALFEAGGAKVDIAEAKLQVTGDLGEILANCLDDAEAMYRNEGEKLASKYGYDERQVLFNWWMALESLGRERNRQKEFQQAKVISLVQKRAVETSYNYYKIEPQELGDRLGFVAFSLVFYVFYTLWYGVAIMFVFEGSGLHL